MNRWGLLYAYVDKGTDVKIFPSKEILLHGISDVLADVNLEKVRLVVTEDVKNSTRGNVPYIVAIFNLPDIIELNNSLTNIKKATIPLGLLVPNQKENSNLIFSVQKSMKYVSMETREWIISVDIEINNLNKSSLTLPSTLAFYFRDGYGIYYPGKLEGLNNITLKPNSTRTLNVTTTVSAYSNIEDWSIVIGKGSSSSNNEKIVSYALLALEELKPTLSSVNQTQFINHSSGKYSYKLLSVQRLPLKEEDILAVDILLKNTGENISLIPEFDAFFLLDKNIQVPVKILGDIIPNILKSGEEKKITLYTKIPYTFSFEVAQVILNEQLLIEGGNKLKAKIGNLTFYPSDIKIPKVAFGKDIIEEDTKISVGEASIYQKKQNEEIIAVRMELNNLRKRYQNLPDLSGYFITNDGSIYPAQVDSQSGETLPNGKQIITLWTNAPMGTNEKGVRLIAGIQTGEDMYVRASDYTLNFSNPYNINGFFPFPPFQLSLTNWELKDGNVTVDVFNNKEYGVLENSTRSIQMECIC